MHLHEPLVPGPTTSALLGTKIPSVGTFHWRADRSRQLLPRTCRKPATGVAKRLTIRTAVSEDARRTAQESLGRELLGAAERGRRRAVHQGRPVAVDRAGGRSSSGRHEPRKGLGVLLDAWQEIDRDAVLWVASDGPETAALRAPERRQGRVARSDHRRREGSPHARGRRSSAAPAISGESFGVVLLEAMAASTAVVASDIDGYRNVARPDVEALMAAPGDAQSLCAMPLRRLLDDPDRRAELADAGAAPDRRVLDGAASPSVSSRSTSRRSPCATDGGPGACPIGTDAVDSARSHPPGQEPSA